jgi:spore protease
MKTARLEIRTDLALEEREGLKEQAKEVSGVSFRKWKGKTEDVQITEVKVLNEAGAETLGKPVGSYLTLEANRLLLPDEDFHSEVSDELANVLKELAEHALGKKEREEKKAPFLHGQPVILVAGLGNQSVTPDSLGPRTVNNLSVSQNETGLKAIAPGVMAQTGMETARILSGIIREIKPDLVIAIDALAARSIRRLGTTIQLTDTGIHPGSGVGNHRHSLTKETLGIPVLAVGVPTVVGAAAIVHDTISALTGVLASEEATKNTGKWIENMNPEDQYRMIRELLEPEFGSLYVTPPDIDQRVKQLSFTISEGIHRAVTVFR